MHSIWPGSKLDLNISRYYPTSLIVCLHYLWLLHLLGPAICWFASAQLEKFEDYWCNSCPHSRSTSVCHKIVHPWLKSKCFIVTSCIVATTSMRSVPIESSHKKSLHRTLAVSLKGWGSFSVSCWVFSILYVCVVGTKTPAALALQRKRIVYCTIADFSVRLEAVEYKS